jgi:hypothetical protein
MKKAIYYTLNFYIVNVYIIEGNVPRRIYQFGVEDLTDLDDQVKNKLISVGRYHGGDIKAL